MKSLPVELLHKIFSLLHQHDKLECMTVCRRWTSTIENVSLFSTVRIGSMHQMNKLVERARQDPSQGAKVERLVLDVDLDVDFKMDILPFLFPNVQEFFFFNIYEKNDNYHMVFTKKLATHPWYQHIKYITEHSIDMHTQYILGSGVCTHLETIIISGTDYDLETKFITLLANAPCLTTLSMSDFSLGMLDIELLHETVPLLHTLILDDGQLTYHRPPDTIKPAPAMTKLVLKSIPVLFVENEIWLLHYISLKYPNLTELSYDVMCMNQEEGDMEKFYSEGFMHLAQTYRAQLKKLALIFEYPDEDPFKMMDDANCQIQELMLGHVIRLPLLERLSRSNQARFIQALTVDYILDTSNLEWLKEFTSLKELSLYHPYQGPVTQRKVIQLKRLLEMVGHTLEKLKLRTHHVEFDTTHRQYQLKHLSFDWTSLPDKIDAFISKTLPHLHTLKFKRCIFAERSFLLPSINLRHFQMVDSFPQKGGYVSVTTLTNDEERWYTAKPTYSWDRLGSNEPRDFPAILSHPFDEMSGSPSFSLVCHSLKKIFVVNTIY